MLENLIAANTAATVKRYAPPNQRNRSLGRRKSGDRLEWASNFVNDGEKNQINPSCNVPVTTPRDAGVNHMNENSWSRLISIHGCCTSEASHLLNNRWAAAMNAYNKLPEHSAERPVLYTGKGPSSSVSFMLPHQLMQKKAGTKDFLTELRQAMHNANASYDT